MATKKPIKAKKEPKPKKPFKFVGRPRVWNPDELAIKLNEWSKQEDSRWLGDFLILIEAPSHTYLSRWAEESEDFATSLRMAKLRIASRVRNQLHDDSYNASLFHREIGMYDSMLKAHDREEKEFEASLKDKQNTNVNEEALKSAQSILTMIAAFQNKKS